MGEEGPERCQKKCIKRVNINRKHEFLCVCSGKALPKGATSFSTVFCPFCDFINKYSFTNRINLYKSRLISAVVKFLDLLAILLDTRFPVVRMLMSYG